MGAWGMDPGHHHFPSEKDFWLGLLVWSPMLLLLYEAVTDGPWPVVLVMMVYGLIVGWLWFGTHYHVTADTLNIVSGPFRYRVPLASIRRVRSSHSPVSAPALSLRRLEILTSDGRTFLISPKDRQRFLALVRARCPRAHLEA